MYSNVWLYDIRVEFFIFQFNNIIRRETWWNNRGKRILSPVLWIIKHWSEFWSTFFLFILCFHIVHLYPSLLFTDALCLVHCLFFLLFLFYRYGRRAVFYVGVTTTVVGRLLAAFTTWNLYLFRGTSLIGICGITAMYLSPYIIGVEISKPYDFDFSFL